MRVSSIYMSYDKHLHISSSYISAYKNNSSFYKEKNVICINLYDSNEYLVFKKVSVENILETMLWYNRNPTITT